MHEALRARAVRIFVILFGSLALLTGATVALSSAASADTVLFTATTHITNDPDSGGINFWALDGPGSDAFTRVLTVSSVGASECTNNGVSVSGLTCYAASIADNGDFTTITGAKRPNQGDGNGDSIVPVVSGTFAGSAEYVFAAPAYNTPGAPSASHVPATVDGGGTPTSTTAGSGVGTSTWFSRTGVSSGSGKILNTWSWTYKTNCETWVDSFANGDGQSNPLSTDGQITGNTSCTPPPPPVTDTVTVSFPNGNETTREGSPVSDIVLAHSSEGHITGFSMSGNPPGLSITNNGDGSATISGTPTASGSFTVNVTATDSASTTGSNSFTWVVTLTAPPPPTGPHFGTFVNQFNGAFDVFQQKAQYNQKIVSWPYSSADVAQEFLYQTEGSNFRLQYAPNGAASGWCVSNATGTALVLRVCNTGPWQQFKVVGNQVQSVVSGGDVEANGTGAQLTVGPPNRVYHWGEHA